MSDHTTLGHRVEAWMADHRPALDELMKAEGSRALHVEFLEAEGGVLPSREVRIDRARTASVRAWLRHLARGLEAELPEPALGVRIEQRFNQERLEALVLEANAATERRGRASPDVDARRDQLAGWMRLFAEGFGEEIFGEGTGPQTGKRLTEWWRDKNGRVDDIANKAAAAWAVPTGDAQDGNPFGRVEADERTIEAASVWAHVRVLADGLADLLTSHPNDARRVDPT
jgi:hypothetical protein